MYIKIFFNIILMVFLAIIQIAFIAGLPLGMHAFNFIFVILVVILSLFEFKLAVWWALGLGILSDLFSFMPFGVNAILFLITLVSANFLLKNFFTNRSLYAFLALTLFSSAVYKMLMIAFTYAYGLFTDHEFSIIFNKNFWQVETVGMLANLGAILIIFYLFNFFSGRFKPVFLVRRRNN